MLEYFLDYEDAQWFMWRDNVSKLFIAYQVWPSEIREEFDDFWGL